MKTIQLFTLLLCCSISASQLFAQSEEKPHAIRIGGGVHDSYGPFDGPNFPLGIWNKNNLDPAIQVQYAKYLNPFIDIGANVTAVDVDNMYSDDFSSNPLSNGSTADLDVFARYKFYNDSDIKADALFKPYVWTGVSGTYISALEDVTTRDHGIGLNVPVGAGVKVGLTPQLDLDLNGAFRAGLFNKIPHRWEHTAGLSFKFGKAKAESAPAPVVPLPQPKDSDNDGIIDAEDDCPQEFGYRDSEAGVGCPYPEVIAPAPPPPPKPQPKPKDTDGDGVIDDEDACPEVAGLPSLDGCPPPVDTDGDGIPDKIDRCPAVPGVPSQMGCPEQVDEVVKEQLQDISKNIFFETNSFIIKAESKAKLDEVISIMSKYSNFDLRIEGHTDSSGAASYNQTLSEKRAAAVKDYLISRGASSARVSSAGYGEEKPIADNTTAAGRAKNRRVEVLLQMK